jgi:hypothetical protein
MANTKFMGVYALNRRLRAYQFYFEPKGPVQQEILPVVQAFGLPGKQSWVLSEEEYIQARAIAGRIPNEENNPA